MKKKRMYLTKNRLKMLENAITVDDILYEKFNRMMEDISKRAWELERTYKKVNRVIEIKDGNQYVRKVINVDADPREMGLTIFIEG